MHHNGTTTKTMSTSAINYIHTLAMFEECTTMAQQQKPCPPVPLTTSKHWLCFNNAPQWHNNKNHVHQ
jgi:hypothetical protein